VCSLCMFIIQKIKRCRCLKTENRIDRKGRTPAQLKPQIPNSLTVGSDCRILMFPKNSGNQDLRVFGVLGRLGQYVLTSCIDNTLDIRHGLVSRGQSAFLARGHIFFFFFVGRSKFAQMT